MKEITPNEDEVKINDLLSTGEKANIELAFSLALGLGNNCSLQLKEQLSHYPWLYLEYGLDPTLLSNIRRLFLNKKSRGIDQYSWRPGTPFYWLLYYDPKKEWPVGLDKIPSVEYLDFDYFLPLPTVATRWQKLHTCNISDAAITYTELPSEIYQYPNLKILRIRQPNLERLNDDMGYLKGLQELVIKSHNFEELPNQLIQLKELQTLVLSGHRTMRLSSVLGELQGLKFLRLNYFGARTIKKHFAALPALTKLHLQDNLLTKAPSAIMECSNLRTLNLSENKLESFPQVPPSLRHLDLSDNELREFPGDEVNLSHLKCLYLGGNQMEKLSLLEPIYMPELPLEFEKKTLQALSNLEVLKLENNKLSEVRLNLADISQNLVRLSIFGHSMTNLPSNLWRLSKLKKLIITYGDLLRLPEEIDQLSALEELDLSNNRLTYLPSTIGSLKQLRNLILRGNKLKTLTESIGQLRKLRLIALPNNSLKELPATIGECRRLTTLDLNNNELQTLPKEIGKLKLLKSIYLKGNPIQSLPLEIMTLPKLEIISLDDQAFARLSPEIKMFLTTIQVLPF